jgi:hypothetical protein
LCINNAGIRERHGITGSWNLIWHAKIPPKVKNILWHIGHNVLPTRVKLINRGVQCPVNCAVCNEGDEDSMRVFFICHKKVQCWQHTGLWLTVTKGIDINKTVADNLFSIMQRLDTVQQELFNAMLWSIWKRINNQVWDNAIETNQTVCDRARVLLASWKHA